MLDSPFAPVERQAGAVLAERFGVLLPEHYGNPEAEYWQARRAAALLDGSFHGLLEITGGERLRWLNGQITTEVKSLRPGEGGPAAVLNAKGHVLAELAVCGLENSVWIACQQDRLEVVRSVFDQHIIADDVKVDDATSRWSQLVLAGPTAASLLQRTTGAEISTLRPWHRSEATVAGVRVQVVATGWLSVPTFALAAPRESGSTVWRALLGAGDGIRPVGMAALDVLRVEAGWPWFGVDYTEQNLLLEALSREHVSFTKGCYIGQEVVVRAEHQGHLNKRLCGLALPADATPARGAVVFSGERSIGAVTSAVSSPALGRVIALALLRHEAWEPGTPLTVDTTAGRRPAEVVALPVATPNPTA
jgi:folate-binding protein YgfZ